MLPELQPIVDFVLVALDRAGLDQQARELTLSSQAVAPSRPGRPDADEAPDVAARVAARLLPSALEVTSQHLGDEPARTIAGLSDRFRWRQTAGYVSNPPHPGFLAAYGHTALIHRPSASPLATDPAGTAVALGLLLLGAGNRYPHHRHPADEVYIPLTTASWSSALDAPFANHAPGEPLHHHPDQPHAVEAGSMPLLTIYLWTGDTTTPAHFC